MSKENNLTIATYKVAAQKYLDNTIAHDKMRPGHARKKQEELAEKIRAAFGGIPSGARVLEIGSADGNNAKALESFGYEVIASDIAPAFLTACKKRGLNTIEFNALKDEFPPNLHGILCWRVFVHFTREDIKSVLLRMHSALSSGGRLMFNVIDRATHDCDAEMIDFPDEYHMGAERYYAYYDKAEIEKIVSDTPFKIYSQWHEVGGHNSWWCFVLEK